ncbi:MAG: Calx-beta domain-containing protein [Verrucomicrobiota bacterium]
MVSLCAFFPANGEPPVAQDIPAPNEFWFTSETCFVDEDATNAVITVGFRPGDRSWQGWVNYSVSNGTATADEDYTSLSGTLYFSGPGTPIPRINIPIHSDNLRESDETVQLFLWNTNAIISRSNATLIIIDKRPRLEIVPTGNGTVTLSWPAQFSDLTLEKTANLSTPTWTGVSSSQNISNGCCHVTEPCSGPPAFYRLRKISL